MHSAESVAIGREVLQTFGNFGDDLAQFGIALGIGFAEFIGVEIDF